MTSYRLNRFNSFFMGDAAVILLAVWRVFVRKHRKVYCSILQCHHCPCDKLGSPHGGVVSHRASLDQKLKNVLQRWATRQDCIFCIAMLIFCLD